MPKYDPNQDIPYGIASADFPVTFYDRPAHAFANVLRGDIDGVTRAMLSPDTLSPSQMKTVRDTLTGGKKVNSVLKTIMDISTNPLVIMGLVVGLWKFPLGTTTPLLALRRGLAPKAAAMGEWLGGLSGAMMNLRTVPYLFETLLGVTIKTTEFMAKHSGSANKIFKNAGPLSKIESYTVSATLDGLHKTTHTMAKAFHNEPEWLALMGRKDAAIAPNLPKLLSTKTNNLKNHLRGWYNGIRKQVGGNRGIIDAVEKQGLKYGEDVEDYFTRKAHYNRYYKQSIRGTFGTKYRKYLYSETPAKVGGEQIARTGMSFGNLNQIAEMESAGLVTPGFSKMARTVLDRWSREAGTVVQNIWDDVVRLGGNEIQQRKLFSQKIRDYYTKGPGKKLNFVGRLGHKEMADDTLDAMAGALQNAKFSGAEAIKKEVFEIGKVLAEPAQYSLNVFEATGHYVNSVANSWAWHGTGLGKKVWDIVKTPGVFNHAPHLENYVKDNLIPHVRGMKSWQEMRRTLWFSRNKEKMYNWIKETPIVEQTLGKKTKDWLLGYLGNTTGSLSVEGMGAKIAHGFYLSTLGMNISPASKNLLQNFLTTMNVRGIGPQGIYRGLMGVGKHEGALPKMGRYLRSITSGVSPKVAFAKAFPEYVDDMGEASQIVESLLAGDVAKEGIIKMMRTGGAWEKIKTAMLMPFSTSEGFNRIVGYYAGRNSHLFHNAGKLAKASGDSYKALLAEAGQVGQTLTMISHFTGGPLGIPKILTNLWAPWRQFMHFPTRFAGFLHSSLRMGADPNKLDWGTIGRTVAGSTGAYIAARNLAGVDISSGLMAGALPVPTYEKSPFYPFPIVSPLISVMGEGAKALLTGDPSRIGSTASLLVPGGIMARRTYRSLAPRFADYKNRTPDGRIPVYNDNHALIGSYTPIQLTLRTLGLKPSNMAAEQGAAQWLLSQRERLRSFRRDWLQALMENDNRLAEKINQDFQKVYPELGPLQIKKSDIRAIENRRQISRIHRIEKGIPSAYRPLFSRILGEASLGQVTEDIEMGSSGLLQNYLQ